MKWTLSTPSKTFLSGEYAVLAGGPSLIVSTQPRFQLKITSKGTGVCQGLHKKSPAGLWIQKDRDSFQEVDIQFVVPHKHRNVSGFGASTAQFLSVYTWSQFVRLSQNLPQTKAEIKLKTLALEENLSCIDIKKLWEDYQKVAWSGVGAPPSGADLLGQYLGGISTFSLNDFCVQLPLTAPTQDPLQSPPSKPPQTGSWPFPNHGFFIISTGHKLATHKHLKKKSPNEFVFLKPLSESVGTAFSKKNWSDFVSLQREFYKNLHKKDLTDIRSTYLIQQIQMKAIDFIKPCGALGVEALMVFFENSHREEIAAHLDRQGLLVVASERDICEGAYLRQTG